MRGDALGLFLRMRDDRLRVGRGLGFLALVLGQELLGLVAQFARFRQLALDAHRALVEHADDRSPRRLPDWDRKDHDGEKDPEFRLGQQMQQRVHQRASAAREWSTAAVILATSGAEPISFSTTERPTSTATPRMSASACSLLSTMRCSAAAICAVNSAAKARWRSAASAAMRSAVALIVAIACARASDSAFWYAALAASASDFSCAARASSSSPRRRRASMIPLPPGRPTVAISTYRTTNQMASHTSCGVKSGIFSCGIPCCAASARPDSKDTAPSATSAAAHASRFRTMVA